jgi:hypothetical protein
MGFLGNAFGFSSIICSVAKNAERLFKKKLNDTSYVPTLHCGTDWPTGPARVFCF